MRRKGRALAELIADHFGKANVVLAGVRGKMARAACPMTARRTYSRS